MSSAICHIITDLGIGGAQTMLVKLLTHRTSGQDKATVLSLMVLDALARPIEQTGIPVNSLDMPRGRMSFGKGLALRRRIAKESPRLLQGWMYHGNLAASFAGLGRFPSLPVVWNVRHSIDDIAQEKRSTRVLLRVSAPLSHGVGAIIYNAEVSAAQHEDLGFSAAKRVVIPNGFDCDRFKPDAEARTSFRVDHGLADTDFVIGVAARDHPMKDITGLLEAFAKLRHERQDGHLVIVGKGHDHANQALVGQIHGLGIGGAVTLLGARDDVAPVMAAFDCLVLPSAWGEGFPNVIGEAMASGLPCISTDVGDSKMLIAENGLIVPPRDRDALAAAMAEMMDLGSEARQQAGHQARRRIQADYSIQQIVRRYDQLYRDLLH